MSTLQSLLASKLLAKKQLKNVVNTDLVTDEVTNKIYFLIEVKLSTKDKEGNYKTKLYKNDITSYVSNHGTVEAFFKSLVVSEMMLSGYLLIPIENGYLCVGGDEVYSMINNECTCPAFLNNNKTPCKHMIYKEGMLNYRSQVNLWKQQNLS
jgi:hypothetical protein